MDDHGEGRTTTDQTALAPAMADLSHIVHNASNLVLGHLAAFERGADRPDRLAERTQVMEMALTRITTVVDAVRSAIDPAYWGPAKSMPMTEVLRRALLAVEPEGTRRHIRFEDHSGDLDDEPERWVRDGERVAALIAALISDEIERLGSGGSITITSEPLSADQTQIDLQVGRDDGLPLRSTSETTVWYWIAEQLSSATGAALPQGLDAHLSSVLLPISAAPHRP